MVKPEQFLSDSPPPRIISTEIEYGGFTAAHHQTPPYYSGKPILDKMTSEFMVNGARAYQDLASLIEYAAPESLGPSEAALHEQGGHEYARDLGARKIPAVFAVNVSSYFNANPKILRDSTEMGYRTTGYHQNFLAPRSIGSNFVGPMASLLAVENMLTGAGISMPNGTFACAGKGQDISEVMGHDRTGAKNKPMIYSTERVEDHADPLNWQRIEVRSGDATMSPWASFMKLAMASVVLRLVEHGSFPNSLLLANPVKALHEVCLSVDGQATVETAEGKKLTSDEWLEKFGEAALQLTHRIGLPVDEEESIYELREAIDDFRKDPELLSDRVDAAAKRKLMAKKGIEPGSTKAIGLDSLWGTLDQNIGIGVILINKGGLRPVPSPVDKSIDFTEPPMTRAKARVDLFFRSKNKPAHEKLVSWSQSCMVPLPNPYQYSI